MARAAKPATGKRDTNKIHIRRDIVARLAAQKLAPHKILKVLESAKETKWLIDGYANKYAIIRNDIKYGPKPIHMVTEEGQNEALAKYVIGLETQLAELWSVVNHGLGVRNSDGDEWIAPLDPLEKLKYMEQITEVQKLLARVQGVGTDDVAPVKTPPGGVQNNLFLGGGSPEALIAAAQAAKTLMEGDKAQIAAPIIEQPSQ